MGQIFNLFPLLVARAREALGRPPLAVELLICAGLFHGAEAAECAAAMQRLRWLAASRTLPSDPQRVAAGIRNAERAALAEQRRCYAAAVEMMWWRIRCRT